MPTISCRVYAVALISMVMIPLNQSFQMGKTVQRAQLLKNRFNALSTSTLGSTPKDICVIGGGLAGLSTTFHLLEKNPHVRVTVIDKTDVGKGGASSVAGGLLHPFSPKGKLLHLGLEGLYATNKLVEASKVYNPDCVLRDHLYRLALTENSVAPLKEASKAYPEYATWLSPEEIEKECGTPGEGGLLLHNGCKVIHMPSYLDGLWKACLSSNRVTWSRENLNSEEWKDRLNLFDTVVYAAGSGLFHDNILDDESASCLPVELVRGQSIEVELDSAAATHYQNEAVLSGKYLTPLPVPNHVLIGATHEYKSKPLDRSSVVEELKMRSFELSPFVWKHGEIVKVTTGYRVQSKRGKYGRMPIIGRFICPEVHENIWLITGLSSRGLIYHGIFGDLLSDCINQNDEDSISHLLWWK